MTLLKSRTTSYFLEQNLQKQLHLKIQHSQN